MVAANNTSEFLNPERKLSDEPSIPHIIWNGDRFQEQHPEKPPLLPVKVSILHKAHSKMHKWWTSKASVKYTEKEIMSLADTGAQTCTSGKEILTALNCPKNYLIKTRHRIKGITDSRLDILGALMLRMNAGGRETKQIVYVCDNAKGFYISQTALKELGVIPVNFPVADAIPTPSDCHAASQEEDAQKRASCGCLLRTDVPAIPEEMPMPPTESNRMALEHWIKEFFASSAMNTCKHQKTPEMTGEPLNMTFKEDAEPTAVHTPIPTPHHFRKDIKEGLDADIALGVIEPMPQGVPTTWCSRMVVAQKKDGKPRRTIDLQKLNKATLRETHHTRSPFNQVSVIPANKKKTVLDAWNGYHSVPLSPHACNATTFITEWGRYRYLRAPMGFHGSNDAYTKRFDDITADVSRHTRCVDDELLWDDTIADAFWHTMYYIKHCHEHGIIFNPDKLEFAKDEVNFAGFVVTNDGYKPPEKILNAIRDFPTPRNITDVRSWFGLINQVSYAFAQATVMAPFRELLASKKRKFYWDSTLDDVFAQSKKHIIAEIMDGVKSFEVNRPTCIMTDWCKIGIGYFLMQKHCDCKKIHPTCGNGHWKLVWVGSRFTRPAEGRYSPVEGEALAVVYGLESCRIFVMGCPCLVVATDHEPLLKILNDRNLEDIQNPRLQDLKEKTLAYDFTIVHVPGKKHCAPDATSRHPVNSVNDSTTSANYYDNADSTHSSIHACLFLGGGNIECHSDKDDLDIESNLSSAVEALFEFDSLKAITWDEVKLEAAVDEECIRLMQLIQEGFPESRNDVAESMKCYWKMRDALYVIEGVPFKDHKMLVPRKLRKQVVEALHGGHQGINGMLANARRRFFWPGLGAQLTQAKNQCHDCMERFPSLAREPIAELPQPDFPFQMTVLDFCDMKGKKYLIYADKYTGWVEVALMRTTTARATCSVMRKWFVTFGVPEQLGSDGGPPLESLEFAKFLKDWGVTKNCSSAYYPQSNGRAELAVKAAKRILMSNIDQSGTLDTEAASRALLLQRNTPVQDIELSPSEMLYGRPLKDHLPASPHKFSKEWVEIKELREQAMAKRHVRSVERYNRHTKSLQPLAVGDTVAVQTQHGSKPTRWKLTGVVVSSNPQLRQYEVKVDGSGRITKRNRRFIRKIDPVCRTAPYSPLSVKKDAALNNEVVEKLIVSPENLCQEQILPMQDLPPAPSIQYEVPVPPTLSPSPPPASADTPRQSPYAPAKKQDNLQDIQTNVQPSAPVKPQQQELRRGQRQRKQTRFLQVENMKGKSYDK